MTRTNTLRIGIACLSLTLIVPAVFAADYCSGVTAKVLLKSSRTGNGQKISYPLTDKAEIATLQRQINLKTFFRDNRR